MTSDATLWRRICAVRSPYVRADWYRGMRFEPDKDIILTYPDDKHMEMRSKMAAGVSLLPHQTLPYYLADYIS
jgi:hypothetical protein